MSRAHQNPPTPTIAELTSALNEAYIGYIDFKNALIHALGSGEKEKYAILLLNDIDRQLKVLIDPHNTKTTITEGQTQIVIANIQKLITELKKLDASYILYSFKDEIASLESTFISQRGSDNPKLQMQPAIEMLHVLSKRRDDVSYKIKQLGETISLQLKSIQTLTANKSMQTMAQQLKQSAANIRQRMTDLRAKDIDVSRLKERATHFGLDTSDIEKSSTTLSETRTLLIKDLQSIAQKYEIQAEHLLKDETALLEIEKPLNQSTKDLSSHLASLASDNVDMHSLLTIEEQLKEMDREIRSAASILQYTALHKGDGVTGNASQHKEKDFDSKVEHMMLFARHCEQKQPSLKPLMTLIRFAKNYKNLIA